MSSSTSDGLRAVPRLGMLTEEHCRIIHRASLEILRRTGVRVYHQDALDLLQSAGAAVSDENLVHLHPGLVEWALKQPPSRVVLCERGTDRPAVVLEGRRVHFGPGSDCLNYLDPASGEHRRFTKQDVLDCIRLVDALPELDFCMSMGIPSDLENDNPYRWQFAAMLRTTSKPIVFVCDDPADTEAIAAMAAAAAGGHQKLRTNPTLLLYSEPTTPLKHSETATGKLLFMAEHSLPIVHSPAPMMGGTAPVTMAGGLALGNAEVLSSLVIHQLKNPGAPFVYGSGLHHLDMKTTISVYSAPEFEMARIAVAELGRYYNLPTWGYAGHSDSCVMDEQAAADSAFSVLASYLAGSNLVHDVGYLEAGLTTSPEMMVFTAEMITMFGHLMSGMAVDEESLALEVIHQVGQQGDYLSTDHTMDHFREFWQPTLYNRKRMDDWIADGAASLGDRLKEKTLSLLEGHQPQRLPEAVDQAVERILAEES